MTFVYETDANSKPWCLGSHTQLQPTKAQGACETRGPSEDPSTIWRGNPCDVTNGNKFQAETDYRSGDALAFVRSYNSSAALAHFVTQPDELEPLGVGWTATYFQRLSVVPDPLGASSDEQPATNTVLRTTRSKCTTRLAG